jgi:hypothetical protein
MSFAITPVERSPDGAAAGDFLAAVDAVVAKSDSNRDALRSGKTVTSGDVVTFAETGGTTTTDSMTARQDVASNSSTIISMSTKKDGADSATSGADVLEQTAVIVKKNDDGSVGDATIINIKTNKDDATKTISISKKNDDNTMQTATITLDGLSTFGDPHVAYAAVSTNVETGLPQSMFLISSGDPGTGQSDVFLVSLIDSADSINFDQAFSNGGFTTFSGRDNFQSFGGAVSIDIGGQKIIVWLDAGKAITNGFSGTVTADYGTFAPDTSVSSSTVSGDVMALNLIFTNGTVSEIWDGTTRIDDFDAFARETAQNASLGGPVDQETIDAHRGTIVSNAPLFNFRLGDQSEALREAAGLWSSSDGRNQSDPVKRASDLVQQFRMHRAPEGVGRALQ